MTYIVIKPKNVTQKDEILELLNNRILDYSVVTDLKEYAENQINVNVSDGVSFTMGSGYNSYQSFTNDSLSSTVDTDGLPSIGIFSDRSYHYQSQQPTMTESNRNDAQQYPYSQLLDHGYRGYTNHQSHLPDMNESNGYGTQQYNYSQSLAHEYEGYIGDALSMGPSTSTATKRKMDNEDCQITSKKPRTKPKNSSPDDIQCRMCSRMFSSKYRSFSCAEKHAVTHEIVSKLKRFKCPVDGCNFKRCWMWSLKKHVSQKHRDNEYLKMNFELTPELDEEWVQHVKKCFPETSKGQTGKKKCELCNETIADQLRILREHAFTKHLEDTSSYKCNQPGCCFKSKHSIGLVIHSMKVHKVESKEITLTDDQKKDVDDMMKICFPEDFV